MSAIIDVTVFFAHLKLANTGGIPTLLQDAAGNNNSTQTEVALNSFYITPQALSSTIRSPVPSTKLTWDLARGRMNILYYKGPNNFQPPFEVHLRYHIL